LKISLAILLLAPTLAATQTRPQLTPRPHRAPVVRLLEPGALPLSTLRYALKGTQQVTVVAGGTFEVKRGEQSRAMGLPILTTPVKLTPAKDRVEFIWLKGSFESPPGQPPDTTTGHLLTALDGSSGVLATDARGVISQIVLKPGPSDKATGGMLENRTLYATEMGKGILSLLVVPLPEEPIGVGGRWQVERLATRGPLSFIQVTTFTLLERRGSLVELSYRLGGKYDESSGLRPEELQLGVSGGGTCTLDLALPLPVRVEEELLIDAHISGATGPTTHQTTRVRTVVESK
jgi:hypothetical protein